MSEMTEHIIFLSDMFHVDRQTMKKNKKTHILCQTINEKNKNISSLFCWTTI